jgi:type VI protein secretion system component VasF
MYTTCWYAGGYPLEEGLRKWAWRETMPATMAKKKPAQQDAAPAPGSEKKADQHKSNRLVRLPGWLHDMLKEVSLETRREMTELVREALVEKFERMGKKVPPAGSST